MIVLSWRLRQSSSRSKGNVLEEDADGSREDREQADGFQNVLPERVHNWDSWVLGQPSVCFRIACVVQHVNHMRTAHALGIVDSGILESGNIAKLRGSFFREFFHFRLCAEVQTTSGTCCDAC